jgi:hypothetical protein
MRQQSARGRAESLIVERKPCVFAADNQEVAGSLLISVLQAESVQTFLLAEHT